MTLFDWIVAGVIAMLIWAARSHQQQINWNQSFLIDEMNRLNARADELRDRIDGPEGEVDDTDGRT